MGTSSVPLTFTGQSTFSSSFQQVLQRAVSIASLPMQQVENEIGKLENQQTDLSTLQSNFSSLQNAVQAISTAMTGSVTTTSSDPDVVTATAQSNTLPGQYSIQVQQLGTSTTTVSNPTATPVTDPSVANISSSRNYTLTVNGVQSNFTLQNGSLDSLAAAIDNSNAGVSATIVNLGSNASPDYRLALTSKSLGADTIQLNDGSSDLLSTVQTGTDTQYYLNGNTTNLLSSTSDQVTLAPGLTATLLGADPGQTVNITVAASEQNLANALSNFATAYNSAASSLSRQTGQGGGSLAGQSLIYGLQGALRQIAQFTSAGGSVNSMTDLGLTLGSDGTMSFDATQFNSMGANGIQQFLGGLTSGGFLQSANNILTSYADPTTGALTSQFDSVVTQITNDQNQVSDDQARINLIQANLTQQLSAADAAISVLQEQNSYFTNLFQTENANHMAGLF
ncbi:MAG: flagellar filament capping protein FliD [Ignavibacteriota bacterium]